MTGMTKSSASLALLFLAGCVGPPVSYVQTGPGGHAPLPENCPVQTYLQQAPQHYEELGVAEVEGGNLEARFTAARHKACAVGGNGIIPQAETTALTTTEFAQYRTGVTSAGRFITFTTTSPHIETYIIQKFIIIRTPD